VKTLRPSLHAARHAVDRDVLWEIGAKVPDDFYAWVAGEAAAVKSIREILLKENRLDCGSVNLMGYRRQGKVLD
jgi:NADPH-dependent ferric siderophore reductase